MSYIINKNRRGASEKINKITASYIQQIVGMNQTIDYGDSNNQFYQIHPAQVLQIIHESDNYSDVGKILVRPLFQNTMLQTM